MALSGFKLVLFLSLFFLSIQILAQDMGDSLLVRYHYNHDYNYERDTILKPLFHPDSLIRNASHYIGTAYISNGKEPGGFDCSGFTFYNFKRYGIYLPYYSFQQAEVGHQIPTTEAKRGDLIVFKGHDITATKAGHVGIVADVNAGRIKFIHASTSHGVRYDFADGPYFKERFMMVRRIVEK